MKTTEKSSSNSLIQRSQHPFFSKRGDDSFFAPNGSPVQAKIEIGQPNDPYEQEADAMAEQVVQKKEVEPNQKDKQKLQTKPISESVSPIVQKKRNEEEESGVSQGFEKQLNSTKGGGSPMPESVKSEMESGFGHDFSSVRLHTDSNAVQMSKNLNAQAFAHGNDVYFNENKYNPHTTDGKKLLAHELTHTVQQGKGVKKKMIQKAGAASESFTSKKGYGKIERNSNSFYIEVTKMKVPNFKKGFMKKIPFTLPKTERENLQIQDWENEFTDSKSIAQHVSDKLKTAPKPIIKGSTLYGLKVTHTSGDRTNYLIGSAEEIATRMLRPNWDINGRIRAFHVDHKQEYQLEGEDRDPKNLWLLDGTVNINSGEAIKNEKYARIQELMDEAHKDGGMWKTGVPQAKSIKNSSRYEIKFLGVDGGLPVKGGNPDNNKALRYHANEIRQGKPLDGLTPLTTSEIKALGLDDDTQVTIFSNANGGRAHKIKLKEKTSGARDINLAIGVNVRAKKVILQRGNSGEILDGSKIEGEVFGENTSGKRRFIRGFTFTFPIKPFKGIPNAGYIDSSQLAAQFKDELKFIGMSPIRLKEASIDDDDGFSARGAILPSVPLLKDANIDIVIQGDDVYFEKVFTSEQLNVPKPFKINETSIFVRAGTNGFQVGGIVDFEIEKVGKGSIEAKIGSDREFGIKGEFEFDPKLFSKAKVAVSYENKKFKASGEIEIGKGKVTGIKKATATVNYAEGVLTADGNAELDVKGLDKGSMNLRYDGKELTIGGSFQLSKDIPRIKSGSVSASVTAKEGGEYSISASGTAQPDIPGINSSIGITYNDGALTIEGSVDYEKGIAKGSVKMGATNRAVGADGVPAGKPGDKWTIYGEGSLNLKLTPWLQATAGVKFSPAGELSVSGKIGLPSAVNVFERKEINKNLFHFPTLEIPLLAIPVGPRSIGLVATIGGGIDLNAGFGPGKLEELFAEVNYTVGQEDSLSLHGRGKFVVPADATVRIFGRAGIGLSIGIARVSGAIELGAAVGIKGAAEAEVDVNWDPKNGVSLEATGRIYVEPVLKFDVNLVLEAVLDLYFYELRKEWKKNLAQKEFGSGMRFGLEFPVKYKEGEPFNISTDDIKVIKPDLDISAVVNRFKDELF
ncbi:MAG: DUF4157 domain-containing protein [Spirosomataceae bacterium]